MSLFSNNKYTALNGNEIDLPVGFFVELKRNCCTFNVDRERNTYYFKHFRNRDYAIAYALKEYRKMVKMGHNPRSKRIQPKPLPCGNVVRWVCYIEQEAGYGQTICRFNLTYPDIEKDKAITRAYHIGMNCGPNTTEYKEKLGEVSAISDLKRKEYREEFIKRFPKLSLLTNKKKAS